MTSTLLAALSNVLDASRISTDRDTLRFLARDALHPQRLPEGAAHVEPLCVVRPHTTPEVAAVMRLANACQVPVVPMGGGSGLMGGAASIVPAIVLDTRAFQEMRIRVEDRMADVGAGVTIQTLNRAAAPHGLMCAHDPWTVAVATVGGTIGTNSLGYLGGKYGAMGDQVLGLEVVLPTGEIVQTRGLEKSSTGPALHRLFIGAEGCFGVVTRATLRLFPLPQERLLQGWRFADFATGFAAIQAMLMAGLRPGLLEFDDEDPTPQHDPPAMLFASFEGARRVARAEAEEAQALCAAQQGELMPSRHVEAFWEHRHDLGDTYAAARQGGQPWYPRRPPLDYLHVALPPSAVLAYRRQCLAVLAEYGLHCDQTGLWGQAGLFSAVFTGGDIQRLGVAHQQLLEHCFTHQGSMEYCHGVGTRLAALMEREHGVGLEVLRRLKRSLDPQGILNPGKMSLDRPAAGAPNLPETAPA